MNTHRLLKNEMSDVPNNVWEDIHDGMRRVVQTHEQFNGLGVTLSGKTGTAELDIYHPNHGLFIGYTTLTFYGRRGICDCCPYCKWIYIRKCLPDCK